jgi:glucans biosynthesis protein
MKLAVPRLFPFLATLALSASAWCQTWEREDVGFDNIQSRARDLANKPYVAPNRDRLPEWMHKLTRDQYRDIHFNPNQALWATDNLPFRAMFFHPGYLYPEPVTLNEFTSSHQQQIRLAEAYFNYGPSIQKHGELPPDGGFSGFRLHTPLNNPNNFDELIAFQGASSWRALGKNQRYGISSRGIAVDTGIDNVTEEFPSFREFWLRKPAADDTHARIYALLDGPSYTGAYAFTVHPGNETLVDVRAVIFTRRAVQRLGIAPMSSMFWFGENSRRRFDDFHPEVHDSDGLAIRMGSGERLWRPISNDSGKLELSTFNMEKCEGFGLLQRDRRPAAYEDVDANYQLRPSLWIEPTSDWGSGRVILIEIPSTQAFSENIVAMWEPSRLPQPGDRLEFAYQQHWTTMNPDPSQSGGYVVATRSGLLNAPPEQRIIVVEFAGSNLSQPSTIPLTADVKAVDAGADKIKIHDVTVQAMPEDRWRVTFQISPATQGAKLTETGPVEIRCCLKRGENFLTETWVHRVIP